MQFIGRHANKFFWFGTALLSCLIFPVPLLDRGVMLFQKTLLPTCLAAGFGSLMLGLLGGSIGGSLFSAKLPAFIARISYSLYLVHQLLLFPALVLTHALLEPLVHDLPPSAWWALSLPVFFSMSFILAFLLYKYVEKPFMEGSLSFKRIFSH
jgi:peptidoglycan/LPS O-acetylase OafA/YrhL